MEKKDHSNHSPAQYKAPGYKDQIFEEILERYCNEDNDLVSIIQSDSRFPSFISFYKWIDKNPEYRTAYEDTQKLKAHYLFTKLLTVSEGRAAEGSKDTLTAVSRDRLICDTIKFAIAKVLPKTYGERIDITSDGKPLNIINLGGGQAPPEKYIDITPPTPLISKTKSGL